MNLISAGLIQVKKLLCATLRQEVAALPEIDSYEIEIQRIEFWPHQLWVHIAGVGGKLISYRRLSGWQDLVMNLINNANTLEKLEEIGEVLHHETKNHPYEPQILENLHQAYARRRKHLQKLQPSINHQKLGESWLEHWRSILQYCENYSSLEYLAREIKAQSEQFADLPEVMADLQRIWQNRTQELAATG